MTILSLKNEVVMVPLGLLILMALPIVYFLLRFLVLTVILLNDLWWARKFRLDVERKRGTRPDDAGRYRPLGQ